MSASRSRHIGENIIVVDVNSALHSSCSPKDSVLSTSLKLIFLSGLYPVIISSFRYSYIAIMIVVGVALCLGRYILCNIMQYSRKRLALYCNIISVFYSDTSCLDFVQTGVLVLNIYHACIHRDHIFIVMFDKIVVYDNFIL